MTKLQQQIEEDLAKLFRERIGNACKDLSEMCETADLDSRVPAAIICTETMRLLVMVLVHTSKISLEQFTDLTRVAFEREQKRAAMGD